MSGFERYALFGAAALFALFFLNVTLGAARMGVFLGDVWEMLVLFGACILFVAAVLGLEGREKNRP